MRVRMLCRTFYKKQLLPGQEIDVDDTTAKRWEKYRIAEVVDDGIRDKGTTRDVPRETSTAGSRKTTKKSK